MRNYKCDPLMMGQRLKELRRNAKNSMSQLAFAEEIGTCLGNISKIEQGLRFPTMEILYDYMNYFDGDENLLCGCDGNRLHIYSWRYAACESAGTKTDEIYFRIRQWK